MPKTTQPREVRIIGGNWRGRKVSFADHDQIRPTPARVRETLFNWLQYHIRGSRCLELYAGSGILSLEALSRGAASASLVEASAKGCAQLRNSFSQLAEPASYVINEGSALDYLSGCPAGTHFDLILLDPPFASAQMAKVLPILAARELVDPAGYVYIESQQAISPEQLPDDWELYRQKRAGNVHYCLARPSAARPTAARPTAARPTAARPDS